MGGGTRDMRVGWLEHVAQKWKPVLRNNMRQDEEIERGFDSIRTKRALATACLVALLGLAGPAQASEGEEVDVAVVFAVDISYSMDPEEQALQKQGYVDALNSPEVLQAIRSGMTGKIAIAYFEWANAFDQRMVLPWTIIDGPQSAKAATDRIGASPLRRSQRTSVSGAINFGRTMLETVPYRAFRKVLDISGDGPNNNGDLVEIARDKAIKAGIVINGLPIIVKRSTGYGWGDIDKLDQYYEDCVIGGPGAFMVAIRSREQFLSATRSKIIREVADLGARDVQYVQSDRPKSDCTVGERMHRERWGN